MTVTVGSATLNVTGFTESSEFVGPEWYKWENQTLKRKKTVYGRKRTWTLECIEKDVAWADSDAKYLEEQGAQGNILSFTMDLGNRYQISNIDIYIDSVEITMEQVGSQNIRHFTVTLKET